MPCSEQYPVVLQNVRSSNCKKNPLYGCFEDILIKTGYPLFRILPNLPDRDSIFNHPAEFMTVSINVTGNTRPTVAIMATITDVYDPSLEHYSFHSTLLPPRVDVIGLEKMHRLAKVSLAEGLKRHKKLYGVYPQNLVIMRSGVSVGQVAFVQTKEIAGIKRAIYSLTRDAPRDSKLRSWKPAFYVLMVNKHISEKVYETRDTGRDIQYNTPRAPIVVQKGITSQNIWDCILFIGGGTKAQRKWNPTKLSIIEYPDNARKGEFRNLLQMVHSLHYGFGFAV